MEMKKTIIVTAILCLIVGVASSQVIRGIDMDFVTIGNAGNVGDTRAEANPYGCGAVGYEQSFA